MESRKNKLLAKHKVNKEKIPDSLFKYSSINEKFISALEEKKIWFSNPKIFNNSFDCKINSEYTKSSLNLKNILQNIVRNTLLSQKKSGQN